MISYVVAGSMLSEVENWNTFLSKFKRSGLIYMKVFHIIDSILIGYYIYLFTYLIISCISLVGIPRKIIRF